MVYKKIINYIRKGLLSMTPKKNMFEQIIESRRLTDPTEFLLTENSEPENSEPENSEPKDSLIFVASTAYPGGKELDPKLQHLKDKLIIERRSNDFRGWKNYYLPLSDVLAAGILPTFRSESIGWEAGHGLFLTMPQYRKKEAQQNISGLHHTVKVFKLEGEDKKIAEKIIKVYQDYLDNN